MKSSFSLFFTPLNDNPRDSNEKAASLMGRITVPTNTPTYDTH